jgi:endonuclease III
VAISKRTRLGRIYRALGKHYGIPKWKRSGTAMDCLILTILSQNTNDRNSLEGFRRLKAKYPTWEDAAAAPVRGIAASIRIAGLNNQKSRSIKDVLKIVRETRGSYRLSFLKSMPIKEARAWLLSLPGVGPKTAACVLMFGFGRPVFPVDTHIHRLTKRWGIIDDKTSANHAHEELQALTPDEWIYPLHILIIRHGREICHARKPECAHCALLRLCSFGRTLLKESGMTACAPKTPPPQRAWSMWDEVEDAST